MFIFKLMKLVASEATVLRIIRYFNSNELVLWEMHFKEDYKY